MGSGIREKDSGEGRGRHRRVRCNLGEGRCVGSSMPHTPPDYAPAPRPAMDSQPLQAARERAIGLLTDRFADDSISEVEFEARLAWLGAADTPARVEELVADLTVPRLSVASMAAPGHAVLPAGEQRISAVMSST